MIHVTKGSVSYLSSPCFSTSLGGIGGPARGIHGILAVMYWISKKGAPPPKMVMGSIPTGDAVTGPHITFHEGDVPVVQHNWFASASITVAARGFKKGF